MINIANLLRNAKKGTILWSPLFGPVEFMQLGKNDQIWVRVDNSEPFDKYGRYFGSRFTEAECLLFPSNKVRTWVGWTPPVEPKFKVGDWLYHNTCGVRPILVKGYSEQQGYKVECLRLTYYLQKCVVENEYHLWSIADAKDGDVITNGKLIVIFNKLEEPAYKQHIIAYVGLDLCGRLQITEDTWRLGVDKAMLATKEQRDLLFAKMREAGYEWDENKKELRKIQPHYNIANFKPKQWVLVRDCDNQVWGLSMFSHRDMGCYICINRVDFRQCIPFEGNETLLGTTNACSDIYVNWD